MTKKSKRDKSEYVVFRVWNARPHDVMALWPHVHAGGYGYAKSFCQSYARIGQHGVADYAFCIRWTRPAKLFEYTSLLTELKQRGYKPHVIQRRNAK